MVRAAGINSGQWFALSLCLPPPHSTMRRHHGWNYVAGAQREGTWCKTRSKYVPGSPPLDLEDLLARFLRVPAIRADEKSANLERLYVSCVPSPGREMANFLQRERENGILLLLLLLLFFRPPTPSLKPWEEPPPRSKIRSPPPSLTRNFTRKISSLWMEVDTLNRGCYFERKKYKRFSI